MINLFDNRVDILGREEQRRKNSGLKECCKMCQKYDYPCHHDDCRQWIDYEEDLNCCLISVYKNGSMNHKEVAKRMKMTILEIKKIEEDANQKVRRRSIYSEDIEKYKNFL